MKAKGFFFPSPPNEADRADLQIINVTSRVRMTG